MQAKMLTAPIALSTRVRLYVLLAALVLQGLTEVRGQEGTGTHHSRPAIPSAAELAALPPDGGPHWNRLVFEKSPYLLQHAANPVDWYPWGAEAFERARREDKPVFVSIGYSTCHWCHVMERESFEDQQVAALMNQYFVSIKVDREERPDVDTVYMEACRVMGGRGGWPLTAILTPDKKPIFTGTYFPKHGRFNREGMMDLLPRIGQQWRDAPAALLETADSATRKVQQRSGGAPGQSLSAEDLRRAYQQLSSRFDSARGGFGRTGTKFPTPHNLSFLLRYWKRTGQDHALEMVEKTLTAMRHGGIFDHVGFGFHRYTTEPTWLIPHFEKMLYDQALLAIAYVEAFQATGKEDYARTAREIFTYVLRDMTSPEGGFYSAEDADSEGEEGKFYLWTPDEISSILDAEEAALFIDVFNIKAGRLIQGRRAAPQLRDGIAHLTMSLEQYAAKHSIDVVELRRRLEASRAKLFAVREKRIHPLKDDKILTDWNGLMIAALGKGAQALGDLEYADAAQRAADFLLNHLRDRSGRLMKRYRDGEAGLAGHLEDYAFVVRGLIELYEATFEVRYLQEAIELNDIMLMHFWDDRQGGLFLTADDSEVLLVRSKKFTDGAIPSGNSVAALNLIRLGRITGNSEYERKADELMRGYAATIRRSPSWACQMLCALNFGLGPSNEVVIVGTPGAADTVAMLSALRTTFAPSKVVLLRPDGEDPPPISTLAGFTARQRSIGGQATAYVCTNYACKRPTTRIEVMLKSIAEAYHGESKP